jgi:hypothetical protein
MSFFIDVLVCIVDLLHARTSAPSETLSGYSTDLVMYSLSFSLFSLQRKCLKVFGGVLFAIVTFMLLFPNL